ncbi:hypothetical protein OIB37_34955 [Streptomyces sp. NBC_00820]|uniref:hypothetical protein n=1 Tax=Streptomyces sp. NBC_00820 TaxID=2975842 RepID=UPI002ED19B74|nr:hypothetical protein OIB37_34955 [Streptomyces sp. NBC_00820]
MAIVWLAGCALTGLQGWAVLFALFVGGALSLIAAVVGVVLLAVTVLAGLGSAARTMLPLVYRPRGLWAWTAGVYVLGTAGASGTAVLNFKANHLESIPLLYLAGGACYALAAALFLPSIRIRLTAVGAAAVLAVSGAYVTWVAVQPPTLDEWITANGVDRTLLRVGDPPPGYAPHVLGASETGSGTEYERPDSASLHLGVTRERHDNRRVDARGCPVPFGDPIHCTDDGGGRQLITYEGDYEHQEMRLHLRSDGLVCTVTGSGSTIDLPAARHILSTLRPATDTELAGLVELPVRR